jgi:uncharacterized membrane protein
MAANLREALTSSEQNISVNERILSLLSGAALFGYGMYKRNATAVGSLLISAALLDRGIRGHCAVSEMIGRNTADSREQAERQAEARYALTIDKPSEEIERRFSEPESLSKIINGGEIAEIPAERTSATAMVSGSATLPELSRNSNDAAPVQITNHMPNHLEWRQSAVLGCVDLLKAPGGRGTEVKVVLRCSEPFQLSQQFAAYLARRKLRRGLRQLKQELESGDIPTIVGQPSGRAGGCDLRGGMTFAEWMSLT